MPFPLQSVRGTRKRNASQLVDLGQRFNLSTQQIDKQLLCRQFRRATDSYEQQALIQQRTAEHLLELLRQHNGLRAQRVLEIGCGTGLLTRRLVQQIPGIEVLVLNDLVPDFASYFATASLAPKLTFLPGDIEQLPLPGLFDLIISSSALHWLHDLAGLLAKLAAHLQPNGILAFSLYGPENLREIKELLGIGLDYHSQAEIEAMLRQLFPFVRSKSQQEVLHFARPQDILRHLRQTGVNALHRQSWTRQQLAQFCADYCQRFSAESGVFLTYHPLYFVAQTRG
ncbi:malonyl-ACP O-methyltransferase BioC [Candidatus Electronema sp. PJ]|uniref:malonyl-ACP O-methyltransferase BioC n=1 Tax=Candidatus Electronema sp. PJ TaxID=3401572 RepID=UPI003AA8E484